MIKKVAVVNSGSSSIKYEVFSVDGLVPAASGLLERIGTDAGHLRHRQWRDGVESPALDIMQAVKDHSEGFGLILSVISERKVVSEKGEIAAIGHRVVHGGESFHKPTVLTDPVISTIRDLVHLAPLHNPANLLGIEILRGIFPDIPQVAVFDTAFHQSMPPRAYRYALPEEFYTSHHVRRYGFHGTSHQYVSREAARHLGISAAKANLITLHLGNGASAAAVQGGKSVDTSMGMTPLEGLVMGTRCGDIDPAVPTYLVRRAGLGISDVDEVLNRRSGLLGLCGVHDMREVQRLAEEGDERAAVAIDMYCYRIRKYIGAYSAVLGRVDAVVFTGGIGENASIIRKRSCEGLEPLGIVLDEGKNASVPGDVTDIHDERSSVKVLVIRTNEELEIARQTLETMGS